MKQLAVGFALAGLVLVACSSDSGANPTPQPVVSDPDPTSVPFQSADARDPTPTLVPTRVAFQLSNVPDSTPTPVPTAGAKKDGPSESTSDVSCMVPVLGRSVTDDIVYRGRTPATEE